MQSSSRLFAFFALLLALTTPGQAGVRLGIDVLAEQGFAPLAGKRVGLVTNQTGVNSAGTKTRLVLKKGVNLVALYSPEHGIDGTVGAGKYVASRKDPATGLTVHSLYGPTRKPTPAMLSGVDVLVFDMQDIGVRSYTYVSTMAKCMESCGENDVEFVVLDRPNPLGGQRVEGPGIDEKWRSFVGQFPTPYIHGMTVGELAKMCNARGWMGARCKLTVIPMQGWSRGMTWNETGLRWVCTSPNIPKVSSVAYYAATSIYGSLEGCGCDVGIGTDAPFEMAGAAGRNSEVFAGSVKKCGVPCGPYERKEFGGARLNLHARSDVNLAAVNVYLLSALQGQTRGSIFARYRDPDNILWKVYGGTAIKALIEKKVSPESIVAGWARGVESFRGARAAYLIYQ